MKGRHISHNIRGNVFLKSKHLTSNSYLCFLKQTQVKGTMEGASHLQFPRIGKEIVNLFGLIMKSFAQMCCVNTLDRRLAVMSCSGVEMALFLVTRY